MIFDVLARKNENNFNWQVFRGFFGTFTQNFIIFLLKISSVFLNSLTFKNIHYLGSVKDPDPLDPQHFGFLDPDPDRIQGEKYQPKPKALLSINKI